VRALVDQKLPYTALVIDLEQIDSPVLRPGSRIYRNLDRNLVLADAHYIATAMRVTALCRKFDAVHMIQTC
jgi:hypothetical protein